MLMNEIASAEDTLELYKLVNDSVWAALQKQKTEEKERKAAAQRAAAAKRSVRKPKRAAKSYSPVNVPPYPTPANASLKTNAASAATTQPTTAAGSAANPTAKSNAAYAVADTDDEQGDEITSATDATAAAPTQRRKPLPAKSA